MWTTPKAAHRYYTAVLHCPLMLLIVGTLCHCTHVNINHIYRFLAQHKLVFKSQMGKNVEGDMIRFQVSVRCGLAQTCTCNPYSDKSVPL